MIKVKKQTMVTVYENDIEMKHINNFIKKINSILGDLEFSCDVGYTDTEFFQLKYYSLYFNRCLIEFNFKAHDSIDDCYINKNIINHEKQKQIIETIKKFDKEVEVING